MVLKQKQAHELTQARILINHPFLVIFVDLHLKGEREIIVQINETVLCRGHPEVNLGDSAIDDVKHVIGIDVLEDDVVERAGVDHDLCESGAQVEDGLETCALVYIRIQ